MVAAPELKTALPSVSAPLVDRYRNVTPVWYPWLQRVVKFIDGISTGELIVDGAIKTRNIEAGAITADLIAAGAITADILTAGSITTDMIAADAITADLIAAEAITADAMAANSITADNAAISTAAVDTLQIAGNAVTQAVSATTSTSSIITSTVYTTRISTTMVVSGTQPILVFGSFVTSGARAGTSYVYDGITWDTNLVDSYCNIRVYIGGNYSNVQELLTVFPANSVNVPFSVLFTGISAGTYTVGLQVNKEAGYDNFGVRDLTMTALETKR